ncbi:hypothetical protein BHM03_00019313, partial [Ensete ventricosum]
SAAWRRTAPDWGLRRGRCRGRCRLRPTNWRSGKSSNISRALRVASLRNDEKNETRTPHPARWFGVACAALPSRSRCRFRAFYIPKAECSARLPGPVHANHIDVLAWGPSSTTSTPPARFSGERINPAHVLLLLSFPFYSERIARYEQRRVIADFSSEITRYRSFPAIINVTILGVIQPYHMSSRQSLYLTWLFFSFRLATHYTFPIMTPTSPSSN